MAIPEINSKIKELFGSDLESVVIFGIEVWNILEKCPNIMTRYFLFIRKAHICVEQSAMDFRAQGMDVHIVADCSLSRSLDDRFVWLL